MTELGKGIETRVKIPLQALVSQSASDSNWKERGNMVSFDIVMRIMMDNWLEMEDPKPEDLYKNILNKLSVRMRLSVLDVGHDSHEEWILNPIRDSNVSSLILNLNLIFKKGRLGVFKDQDYLNSSVFPQYASVIQRKIPLIDVVQTKLFGIRVTYDRIILPQKSIGRPNWLVVCTNGRFMASTPAKNIELDNVDETILLHVMAGASAKEIAANMQLSPRTIEHRIERLRRQVGARSLAHLVTMLVNAGFGREITFTAGNANSAE